MRRAIFLILCQLAGLFAVTAGAHDGPRAHHFMMTQVEIRESVLYFDVWVERPTSDVTAEFRARYEHDPEAAEEQEEDFTRANFDRMIRAMTVSLGDEELALEWEPGPLVNNGRGNKEFFTWAIVAKAPVPSERKELDLRIENRIFENEHIFMSCYVQVDGGWRVEFDSATAVLEQAERNARPERSGVSWTHEPSVRNWELRLRR